MISDLAPPLSIAETCHGGTSPIGASLISPDQIFTVERQPRRTAVNRKLLLSLCWSTGWPSRGAAVRSRIGGFRAWRNSRGDRLDSRVLRGRYNDGQGGDSVVHRPPDKHVSLGSTPSISIRPFCTGRCKVLATGIAYTWDSGRWTVKGTWQPWPTTC